MFHATWAIDTVTVALVKCVAQLLPQLVSANFYFFISGAAFIAFG